MTTRNTRQDAGFTLVELLVALAIFMVIMGSLTMLLTGAVNTTRQGYAMMTAMERARGAMSTLEADLKTAFSSPEKQQFFQFYGEPNGFTYSGQLVGGGFGRVTYAVHADFDQRTGRPVLQGTGEYEEVTLSLPWGEVAEQFARVLCPVNPVTGAVPNIDKNDDGVHDITYPNLDTSLATVQPYLASWNVIDSPDDPLPKNGFAQWAAAVFANNIYPIPPEALSDFHYPLDFTLRIRRGVLLRYEERGQGAMTEYSDPIMTAIFSLARNPDGSVSPDQLSGAPLPFGRADDPDSVLATFPEETRERLDQLQQGHYWVRMLSGNLPLNNAVDPFIVNTNNLPRPNFWMEDNGASGKSWRDYLVTEGILVSAELQLPDSEQVLSAWDGALNAAAPVNALDMASFFSFGLEDGTDRKWFNTLWNLPSVALPTDASATPAVRPMFNYFLFGTPANPVAGNVDAFAEALRVKVYGYSSGDPLTPRLPAWVAPGFWIFGDAPRSGAPPFHQWFQQKADIPLAYLRANTGT